MESLPEGLKADWGFRQLCGSTQPTPEATACRRGSCYRTNIEPTQNGRVVCLSKCDSMGSWAAGPDYMAATKLGNASEALPSRSWVMRAAMPVYIEAARKAL